MGSNSGQAGALGVGGGPAQCHVGGGGGGGAYAGGGGGSSFYGNAMNPSTTKGLQAGSGQIKISW